jgi:dienelactone hydrolase
MVKDRFRSQFYCMDVVIKIALNQAANVFCRPRNILLARGFAVWVPTRLGYGESGTEPDPEYSGTCSGKKYIPAYEVAASSTLDVIAYAKQQSYVDPARIVVLGQSYGGTTAITLAAKNPSGLIATINFAGGGGGNRDAAK